MDTEPVVSQKHSKWIPTKRRSKNQVTPNTTAAKNVFGNLLNAPKKAKVIEYSFLILLIEK